MWYLKVFMCLSFGGLLCDGEMVMCVFCDYSENFGEFGKYFELFFCMFRKILIVCCWVGYFCVVCYGVN